MSRGKVEQHFNQPVITVSSLGRTCAFEIAMYIFHNYCFLQLLVYDEIDLMNPFQLTLRFLAYIHVNTGLSALLMDINTEPGGSSGSS